VTCEPCIPGDNDGDKARIKDYGIPVWALIAALQRTDGDSQNVADAYGIPVVAVRAAIHYYERNRPFIDAFLLLNSEANEFLRMALGYIDEDVAEGLTPALQALDHNVLHPNQAGKKGFKDPRQLAFAARTGRTLSTSNRRDFAMLHEAWLDWSREWGVATRRLHPGILVLPSGSIEVVEQLAMAIDLFLRSTTELQNRIFRWREQLGWQEILMG
jgi:uncharacterized protein (DUF433 family)